ncbi:CAP domain-containing protein [Candidatus Parcubacteria bacterium]|nr:MAG: CAP domain-containing protein [Candidatus Parcubacteria bacterium]
MKKKFLYWLVAIFLIIIPFYVYFFYSKNGRNIDLKEFDFNTEAIIEAGKQILPDPLLGNLSEEESFLTVEGVIVYTNDSRRAANLNGLASNEKLNAAAKLKAADMFSFQYFAHVSPENKGVDFWADETGYEYIVIGENLAMGNFKDDKELVEAWMASPGHRENILNDDFTEIGVAVQKGNFENSSVWLAVQIFGKPKSACPKIDTNLKTQTDELIIQYQNLEKQLADQKALLENTKPKGRSSVLETEAYNKNVEIYNGLVEQYKNLSELIEKNVAAYNSQVKAFNNCAD